VKFEPSRPSLIGEWHPEVIAGLAALALLYLWRARGLPAPLPPGRGYSFAAGLLVLAGALNGPLHDLSDHYLFSAHMVQHLLLTLVAPPLLLAGLGPGMLEPVLRRRRLERALFGLTRAPVTFAVYNVTLLGWHLPGPYNAALEHHPLHIVEHLTFLSTAVLLWWPVLSPEPRLPRLHYAAQLLYIFLLGLPMTAVAALITMADVPLYPFYAAAPRVWAISALEDQRLGGLIMWVPAGIAPLAAFTAVFFRWVAAEGDEDAQIEGSSRDVLHVVRSGGDALAGAPRPDSAENGTLQRFAR
jgi:putative membrane protein